MRNRFALGLSVALGLLASPLAQADLLWNNYHTQPDGYDHISALSSERNTIVPDSWTADDAAFGTPVQIQEIRWIAMRDPSLNYPAADVLIMDENFNTVWQASDSAFTILRDDIFPDFPGLRTYEAAVSVPDVPLTAGRYFVATRLVGENGLGRNYVATTGEGSNFGGPGQTMGVFQGAVFGFPNWTPVDQLPLIVATDFAYQVYGVPEPATLVLIALGGLALLRRRA